MKCSNCGKNEATVFFHSNINGKIEEQSLCPECAEKLGLTRKINAQRQSMARGFQNFFDDYNRFFGLPNGNRGMNRDNANAGNWLDSFFSPMPSLMGGFFDNPFDDFFTDFPALGTALSAPEQDSAKPDGETGGSDANINANTSAPENRFAKARKLNALRHEMKQAIKAENFERAAEIRDEIRQFEAQE